MRTSHRIRNGPECGIVPLASRTSVPCSYRQRQTLRENQSPQVSTQTTEELTEQTNRQNRRQKWEAYPYPSILETTRRPPLRLRLHCGIFATARLSREARAPLHRHHHTRSLFRVMSGKIRKWSSLSLFVPALARTFFSTRASPKSFVRVSFAPSSSSSMAQGE